MGVHAFLDESQRNRLYLVGVVVVEPARLTQLRQQLRALHFAKESEADLVYEHLDSTVETLQQPLT